MVVLLWASTGMGLGFTLPEGLGEPREAGVDCPRLTLVSCASRVAGRLGCAFPKASQKACDGAATGGGRSLKYISVDTLEMRSGAP